LQVLASIGIKAEQTITVNSCKSI